MEGDWSCGWLVSVPTRKRGRSEGSRGEVKKKSGKE